MAFDSITYSAVNKIRPLIGELLQVPETFTSDDFVDTGSAVDAEKYPELAFAMSSAFDGQLWDKLPVPEFDSNKLSSTWFTGTPFYELMEVFGKTYRVTENHIFEYNPEEETFKLVFVLPFPVNIGACSDNLLILSHSNTATRNAIIFDSPDFIAAHAIVQLPAVLRRICYGDGYFLAATIAAGNVLYKSVNGISWSTITTSATAANSVQSLAWGNGRWVINTSGTSNQLHTSTNGTNWSSAGVSPTGAVAPTFVFWAAGRFYLTPSSNSATLYASATGSGWTTITLPGLAYFYAMRTTKSGTIVATHSFSTGRYMYSYDGDVWLESTPVFSTMKGKAVMNSSIGTFVTTKSDNLLFTGTTNMSVVSNASGVTYFATGFTSTITDTKLLSFKTTYYDAPILKKNNLDGIMLEGISRSGVNGTTYVYPHSLSLFYQLTNDGGHTWQAKSIEFDEMTTVNSYFVYGDEFLVLTSNTTTSNLYRSTDGINWTSHIVNIPFSVTRMAYRISTSIDLLQVGGYASTDKGLNWHVRASGEFMNSSIVKPGGTGTATTVSFDDGITFTTVNGNPSYPTNHMFHSFASSRDFGIVFVKSSSVSSDHSGYVTHVTTNAGQTFTYRALEGTISFTSSFGVNNVIIVAPNPKAKTYQYTGDGINWNVSSYPEAKSYEWNSFTHTEDENIGYVAGLATMLNGFILRTDVTTKRIAKVSASAPGAKWVVRAR